MDGLQESKVRKREHTLPLLQLDSGVSHLLQIAAADEVLQNYLFPISLHAGLALLAMLCNCVVLTAFCRALVVLEAALAAWWAVLCSDCK